DFFFSSRRRHTRWPRDWSSDVCSSDLIMNLRAVRTRNIGCFHPARAVRRALLFVKEEAFYSVRVALQRDGPVFQVRQQPGRNARSEERRVGKEWRSGGAAAQYRERRE